MTSSNTISNTADEGTSSAVLSLDILKKRADFLRAARGVKVACPGFILQARKRSDSESAIGVRVGFTTSKKVGNAVRRNHARRRLREIARLILPHHARNGFDYVLIGRRDATSTEEFVELLTQLKEALARIHGPLKP